MKVSWPHGSMGLLSCSNSSTGSSMHSSTGSSSSSSSSSSGSRRRVPATAVSGCIQGR
jgi:hypothetical protein